jgi:DNA-binding IclR family transcriptional regulator
MILAEGTPPGDAALVKLAQRIMEEFEEAPGLRITLSEASRFWGLDETTTARVLARLLASGFLATGGDQRYRKA